MCGPSGGRGASVSPDFRFTDADPSSNDGKALYNALADSIQGKNGTARGLNPPPNPNAAIEALTIGPRKKSRDYSISSSTAVSLRIPRAAGNGVGLNLPT